MSSEQIDLSKLKIRREEEHRDPNRPRKRTGGEGVQEHPVDEGNAGRTSSGGHEPRLQPRARRQLPALPRRARLLERRQAAKARRPRNDGNEPNDQLAAEEPAAP